MPVPLIKEKKKDTIYFKHYYYIYVRMIVLALSNVASVPTVVQPFGKSIVTRNFSNGGSSSSSGRVLKQMGMFGIAAIGAFAITQVLGKQLVNHDDDDDVEIGK